MPAPVEITPWHWVGFILFVLIFLALDLGVFHRRAHVVTFKEALGWTAFWVALALGFAGGAGVDARQARGDAVFHRLFRRGVPFHGQCVRDRAGVLLFSRAGGTPASGACSGACWARC